MKSPGMAGRLAVPRRPSGRVPTVTHCEMRRLDRLAQDDFGIAPIQLMEQAGQQMAAFVRWWVGSVHGQTVSIAVGPGNNGADGLVAARYLCNWGGRVQAWLATPEERLHALATRQLRAARAAGVEVRQWSSASHEEDAVMIDALLGIGLARTPEGDIAEAIAGVNQQPTRLALDIPSGVGIDGAIYSPRVAPTATLTLGLPKSGMGPHGGRVFVADIGLPRRLAAQLGKDWGDLFASGSIIELQ